jgi:hypothetical protein
MKNKYKYKRSMSVQYTRLDGLMKGGDMASIRAVMYVGEQQSIYREIHWLTFSCLVVCVVSYLSGGENKRARACNE